MNWANHLVINGGRSITLQRNINKDIRQKKGTKTWYCYLNSSNMQSDNQLVDACRLHYTQMEYNFNSIFLIFFLKKVLQFLQYYVTKLKKIEFFNVACIKKKFFPAPQGCTIFFHTEFFITMWKPSNLEEQLMTKRYRWVIV